MCHFDPVPDAWALIVVELALTILRLAEALYVYLVWRSRQPGLELWPLTVDLPTTGLFVGVAVNLSILKTNKARAVRFSTLEAICRELGCQPGDLLA